jgi:Flp pilus assembly protein TadD
VLEAYRRNDFEAAQVLLEELIELEPENVYATYNLACLYALHGEEDKAMHMLEQAIELGFNELSFARHDPDLASLHEKKRFRVMVGLEEHPDKGKEGAH